MFKKIGVLLVNLGTPDAPTKKAVKKYLQEFLLDPRVIDSPYLIRQLLVRGLIIPKRLNETTRFYQRIWKEEGSPLMIHSKKLRELVQKELPLTYQVEMAMRYQNPSIETGLQALRHCQKIILFPLFPQYASATTGSLYQKSMDCISKWVTIPEIRFISSYPIEEKMIAAFVDRAKIKEPSNFDHILISFHGLPVRHIKQGSKDNKCFTQGCCDTFSFNNKHCYRAECFATARAIAKTMHLQTSDYSVCFQSRLGKEPWLQPYVSDQLKKLAESGKKRILVFSPSFVADCIETIHEIGVEYAKEFVSYGGETLELVESLNDHPLWVEAIKKRVLAV